MVTSESLERMIFKHGATAFFYAAFKPNTKAIMFELNGRRIKYVVKLPDKKQFTLTPTGKTRAASASEEEYSKECSRRLNAVCDSIENALKDVAAGDDVDDVFFGNIVLPTTGKLVKEQAKQLIVDAYKQPMQQSSKQTDNDEEGIPF